MADKLTAREQLELIDALPHGQAREHMLRLMLAEAWHEGWECAYGDGGEDNNAYMTGRELIARREQRQAAQILQERRDFLAQANADALKACTGSRSVTYTVSDVDGNQIARGEA